MQQGNCNIYSNEPHRIEHSPDFSEYVNGSENEANSHFTNTDLETTEEHQFGNSIYREHKLILQLLYFQYESIIPTKKFLVIISIDFRSKTTK